MGDVVTLTTPRCFHCRQAGTVQVLAADLERYRAGAFAQVAFPEMPAPLREQLISGTHPACWDEMFGSGEDDDEPSDDVL